MKSLSWRSLSAFICVCILAASVRADVPPRGVNLLALGDPAGNTPARASITQELNIYAGAAKQPFDGILLLGDIFNMKLTGPNDPLIQTLFEDAYDPIRMNFPFYVALGNHDYEQGKAPFEMAYAKLHPQSRWKLPGDYYRVEFPEKDPLVTVLMLNSNLQPLALTPEQWQAEMAWLEQELAKPHAPWLVCAAHHTMFSNGSHGDNGVLQQQWGTLFKKYHVDFYVCGHDHTMQHLEIPDWPISFVVSGGGGGGRRMMLRDNRGPFSRSTLGFADLHFDADTASVKLLDENGEILHSFTRDRASGKVTTLLNSPSDKATTQPLRTIQGLPEKP